MIATVASAARQGGSAAVARSDRLSVTSSPDARPHAPVPARATRAPRQRRRTLLLSPLLRRVLLVNALPLALLVATLLYLDQFQSGLLTGEVGALREQARIYAGALGQSAVRPAEGRHVRGADRVLVPELARPLLRRLTEPTPFSVARLYAPDGRIIADSNPGAANGVPPSPRPQGSGGDLAWLGRFYDRLLTVLSADSALTFDGPADHGAEGGSERSLPPRSNDAGETLRVGGLSDGNETPPFIRRTHDGRLLITVAEPVQQDGRTVGIVLLTRAADDVDRSLKAVRRSILDLFLLALGLTVLLSWYLARTIARPILSLARAALSMREGEGRTGAVPSALRRRRDEIGELGDALEESARALWARMDAIERFAADVSHEIKNPLTSIGSAIETLRRVDDRAQQQRLLAIIGDDVSRLDRLISDISNASRVDAELSREPSTAILVVPMMEALAEIHEATRTPDAPRLVVEADDRMVEVLAVEDRLVQVLRNLIGNAASFSPPRGTITLRSEQRGPMVEISVTDDGPGIPDGKLEHIFDRFYTERPPGERFGQHSGLGLSISRQIVDALKGRITAENRLGPRASVLGARFVVSLPSAT